MRIVLVAATLALIAGCGEPPGAREVPPSRSSAATHGDADADAATKPARAIPTH